MTRRTIAKAGFDLVAGCSLALLIAAGGGTALAHGGGNHNSGEHGGNAGHGRCVDCGGNRWSRSSGWSGGHKHHHHHHHQTTVTSEPPLHGPGSSHDPIIYHPVHGPGSSHNPIIAPVVRDHRRPPQRSHPGRVDPACNQRHISGCEIRDHRTPSGTQCLGNLC